MHYNPIVMGARPVLATLAAAALACAMGVAMPVLETIVGDFAYILRGARPLQAPVVLVQMAATAPDQTRPWGCSLQELAQAIRQISHTSPKAIVLAITPLTMTPPSESGVPDLVAAIKAARCVVLPACLLPAGEVLQSSVAAKRFAGQEGELLRPAALRTASLATPPEAMVAAAAGLGTTNLYPDMDGAVRSFPLLVTVEGRLFPSLPLEAARVALGMPCGQAHLERDRVVLGNLRVPVDPESAEMAIDYPGSGLLDRRLQGRDLARLSSADLRERLDGQVVIIVPGGPTGTLHPVPGSPSATGGEIIAACVENLLAGKWLRRVPLPAAWLLATALALATLLAAYRTSPPVAVAVDLALLVLVLVLVVVGLSHGLIFPGFTLLAAVAFAGVTNLAGMASAAQRARLATQLEFRSRLQALQRLEELIGTAFDRDELLIGIMRWVTAELDCTSASLLILDERERSLRFQVALGPRGPEVKDFTVPLGHGIAGVVAQTGQPLIVNDVQNDPRHARDIAQAVGLLPRNIICVPMMLHGRISGVIEAMDKVGGALFDEQDEALLATIAQQAALLLENARLYADLQRRVDFANAELRRAYQELEAEKAKVETLIDQLPSPVLATDAENNIVLLNDAFEAALGLRADEAVGKSVFVAVPAPEVVALFADPLDGPDKRIVEEIEIAGARPRVYRVSLAAVHGPDDKPMGKSLVMIDITELRELDQMKTDLISFVSHELRTPLSIISGFTHLAGRRLRGGRTDEALDMVERIDRHCRHTERLVEDFLNIARLEAGRPLPYRIEPIPDVADIVRDVIETEPRRTPAHEIATDIPADLPPVSADRSKLEEVLTNLIDNAIKYSPHGGRIEVSAAFDGAFVRFSVRDRGIGIPEEARQDLFQRYRRVRGESREHIPGTGMGLYLCKQLVEGQGGCIWYEPNPEGGSIFSFTLPVAPKTPDGEDSHARKTSNEA
ncbi:MAG: CHASE2 domain-containing protein [Armatimonadetes bacterium]|nr:CHASE2 domain-containing protein [Armatimonadota bacterium]